MLLLLFERFSWQFSWLLLFGLAPARFQNMRLPMPDASNIAYPLNTQATGAVSLLLSLDNNAQIQNMQLARHSAVDQRQIQDSIQLWTFDLPQLKGSPVPSERLSLMC